MKSLKLRLSIIEGILRPIHPSLLVFFITSRCNCRCSMCFNQVTIERNADQQELPLSAIEKIARSMKPLPQLLLSGGEPFLRDDIADIVKAFYGMAGTRQISIPTNGTLPLKVSQAVADMVETCTEAFFNINLSLDEISDRHDRFRGLKGCFRSLCETYNRLDQIRAKHKRLSINVLTVIKKDNAMRVQQLIQYVKDNFNANYHTITLVRGDVDGSERDFDMSQVEDELSDFYTAARGFSTLPLFNRVAPRVTSFMWKILCESRRQKKRCFPCRAGKKMVVITNAGDLMPCEPLWLERRTQGGKGVQEFVMAHLEDYDFNVKEALASEAAQRIKKFISSNKCFCDYTCAILNSIIYHPVMYANVVKTMLNPKSVLRGREKR